MAITNTVTVTAQSGVAYARGPLPAPLSFTPNMPGFWIWHRRWETKTGTNIVALTDDDFPKTTLTVFTAIGGGLPTDPVRVGDVFEVDGLLYEVIADKGTDISGNRIFVTNVDWPTGGTGSFNSYSISYQRRPNFMRLNPALPITVQANGRTFTPLLNGVNYGSGLISAGLYGTAYYIGVSDYAIAAAVKVPSEVIDDVRLTCTLVNALAATSSNVTISFLPPPTFSSTSFYSCVSNGVGYTHTINGVKVGVWPNDSLPEVPVLNTPATCRAIYLTWRSRYGGWEVMPFNYDLADRVSASSIGDARQGFNVNSIGNEVVKTLNISTGLLTEVYADWLEDMLGNPVVFMATELATVPNNPPIRALDFDSTNWTPYKIEGSLTRSTANTRSCSFAGTITRVELGRAYRL